jgi:hypothetical protein
MFRTIFRLTFLGLLLGGWGMAALALHVVRTPDKIGLIPKEHLSFTDTFVDARKWTLNDLQAHPDLVKRVLEANMSKLFQYLADPANGDVADQISKVADPSAPRQSTSVFGKVRSLLAPLGNADAQSAAGWDSISFPIEF